VLITAHANDDKVAAAMGVAASLAKPFDIQPLLELANSLVCIA